MFNLVREGEEDYIEAIGYRRRLKIFENFLLDKIPYGEMPKWGSTARFLINTKQKLGLGVNSKNVKRR